VNGTGHYRLLALDMDGTLLNEDKQVTLETRKWIRRAVEAGFQVIVSTGRGRQSALPYVEELGLTGPMVLVNGSEVWKSPNELWVRELMPLDEILELRRLAHERDIWYWAYTTEGVRNRDDWPDGEGESRLDWLKFGFYTENARILAELRSMLEEDGRFEVTNSHPFNLELNPKNVNKSRGVAQVCQLLGIPMSRVIAVGDSINDLDMIRDAGLGIAMGNAQEEVKRQADAVTADNEHDGVAMVIRRYLFGEEVEFLP